MKQCILAGFVLAVFCGYAAATEFDPATDYSTTNNPTGTWTWGWFHSPVPGASDLEMMEWNPASDHWEGTNSVHIWKNETGSMLNGVAPGQVSLAPDSGLPAVVRWTAPESIGFSSILVSGTFLAGDSGEPVLDVRYGDYVIWSSTNSGSFSLILDVEPGETVDFIAASILGSSETPLELTITTLEEHIGITTLDDFESYSNSFALWLPNPAGSPWSDVPDMYNMQILRDEPSSNMYVRAEDSSYFWSGAQTPMPFDFNTAQSNIYFGFSGRISDWGDSSGSGGCALRFYDETATSEFCSFGFYINHAYGSPTDPPTCFYRSQGGGSTINDDVIGLPYNQYHECRVKIDWSHMDSEGTYGLLSMEVRLQGQTQWEPVETIQNIEMKIADPAQIKKLAIWNKSNGYGGDIDNIVYHAPVPQAPVSLDVSSLLGSPIPVSGSNSYVSGSVVTCSVASVTDSLTNYACTGWSGTGSVPASGSSTSVVFTIMENSSITWNWQTNYWLDVNVTGSGSVNYTDGWYAKGDVLEFIPTPVPGWLFMGWSGDAAGTNQVVMTMDTPYTITASFSDDADNDGLTNTEEAGLGSNPWKPDTDGDGFGDKLEADHGWNPAVSDAWAVDYIQNNGATFGLYPSNAVLDVAVGQMLLSTSNGNARLSIQLEQSEDLVNWTNAGNAVEWSIPVDGSQQFFRVRSGE